MLIPYMIMSCQGYYMIVLHDVSTTCLIMLIPYVIMSCQRYYMIVLHDCYRDIYTSFLVYMIVLHDVTEIYILLSLFLQDLISPRNVSNKDTGANFKEGFYTTCLLCSCVSVFKYSVILWAATPKLSVVWQCPCCCFCFYYIKKKFFFAGRYISSRVGVCLVKGHCRCDDQNYRTFLFHLQQTGVENMPTTMVV